MSTSTNDSLLCHGKQPTSLLQHCTDLVAGHLDLVESFCGLPSLIGEKIFRVGCMMDRFCTDVQYSTLAVNLFATAYGDEFLSKLNVSGHHLGLNYCLEQILLFTDVIELDVSDCGLGDNHEILSQFEYLPKLEILSLKDNVLSNTGIQKMTAPFRMFSRGPSCLKLIDITGNAAVSRECLKYLAKFQLLHTVMFSEGNNNIKSETHGCWRLSKNGYHRPTICTEGWAKVLIDRWMKEATLKSRSRPDGPKSTTGLFSIKKHHDMDMLEKYASQTCTGNEFRRVCHHFVAERINVPSDKRHTDNRTTKLTMSQDYLNDVNEIQDLYKTEETKNLQPDSLCKTLDSCENLVLNRISIKTNQQMQRSSSVRNRMSLSNQGVRFKHSSTKCAHASMINPFKFGITTQSVSKLASGKLSANNSASGYDTNEISKENSFVQPKTVISNDDNSVKQRTRKRKKIVVIKNANSMFEDSNDEVEKSLHERKANLSSKDDACQSEPAAKKKCLKPSILDSLNGYI